jgi:Uma2 family endonuclease
VIVSTENVNEALAPYGVMDRVTDALEPWQVKTHWTEEEYLALETNRLIEFNNGVLEELPMPDYIHQTIVFLLTGLLKRFTIPGRNGRVVCAPFRMKTANGKYREPDVIYLAAGNPHKFANDFWTGADLVIEIISIGGKKRDTVDKREDYALTGIAEYWIVDPKIETITVLTLKGAEYVEHGVFKKGELATSVMLKGFSVDVTAIFNAD